MNDARVADAHALGFLEHGGEMGAHVRAFDWTTTPLGPPQTWPQTLRSVVRIMLDSCDAMWLAWGAELTFLCNDAHLALAGMHADRVLGARSDSVWGDTWADLGPRIERVLRDGRAIRDEARQVLVERGGHLEEVYHTLSFNPLRDDAGAIAGALCVATDETARSIGERRIASLGALSAEVADTRSEEEVFAAVRRHIGDGLPDLPCALAYMTVEEEPRACCALRAGFGERHPAAVDPDASGWPIGEVLDAGTARMVEGLDARFADLPRGPWRDPPRRALLLPIRETGDSRPAGVFVAFLNSYRPLDGAYRRFLELFVAQIAPRIANARGHVAERGRAAALTEMSARTRAEAALRESEARFRAMADSSPLLIWMIDPAGSIEFVNRAYHEFFGVAHAEPGQGGWSPLLHPEDADGYLAEVTAALAERRAFSVMGRVRRNDGEWRWIQSFGAPRFAADGRFLGAVGSSPDITELIEASDALRDAGRRKDEFLATLAHELRNPLAPIRQAARLWRSPHASEAQRRWSQEVIERQVQHMALLLDDLLDVSRITRGKVELRRQRVRLASIVDAAIETARPFLDARRHGLTLDVPAEPIELDVDPMRIAQVLSNLLTNAAKYSEAGRQIAVAAARDDGGVAISVRDAGIGIEPELLPRVFDMFSQAKSSLDRAEGGLGIGLALVKGLVELHGGRVEARSAGLGHGAEFVVWLPLPAGAKVTIAPDERRVFDRPAAPARILIADDNRDAASSLASLLELDGHETRVVNDGALAIATAKAFRPHVALLDIGMPRLNGYEVAREIRAAPWGKGVTLIAVTGWGQAEDKRRAQEAGFDHHFTKPLDLEVLDACLAEALGRP